MRFKTTILTALTFGALTATFSSVAVADPDRWRFDDFERWDRNGDGLLSKREVRFNRHEERAPQRLSAGPMDEDGDGFVTRREARRFHREEALEMARRLDQNRDGWVDLLELRRGRRGFTRWADLDGDGRVTANERSSLREARRNGGIPVRRLVRLGRRDLRIMFYKFDDDRDGRLDRRELRRARRFALFG